MLIRNILLALLVLVFSGCEPDVPKSQAAHATEWQLARNTGCFMCHTTGKNLLGPAWELVSERYRNNPDAEAYLMSKILNGGRGAWVESRDMPGYPEKLLTTENRKLLVNFILSIR